MKLPIERIPYTSGTPQYRWYQTTSTMVGPRTIEHKGTLPPTMAQAVEALIALAKQQAVEIKELQKQLDVMTDQIAAQSETLKKSGTTPQPTPVTPTKKGK